MRSFQYHLMHHCFVRVEDGSPFRIDAPRRLHSSVTHWSPSQLLCFRVFHTAVWDCLTRFAKRFRVFHKRRGVYRSLRTRACHGFEGWSSHPAWSASPTALVRALSQRGQGRYVPTWKPLANMGRVAPIACEARDKARI